MKSFILITIILLLFPYQSIYGQDNYSKLRGSPEDSLTTKDFPGAWNLPNTDLYLKFGGYFRLDVIYDFNGAGSRNQLLMNQIPADNTPEASAGPFFNMHVRETRFNFDLRRTTDSRRPLKFFLEFDFFDESLKAGQPRLRHAFVKYGNLLVGQTWTNLSDLRVFPFIMDFSAGDALFGGRTIQIRYEKEFIKNWQYGVSLEMPALNGIYNPFNQPGEPMPVVPIFSARITNNHDNGMITLGGQIEQLRWDGQDQGPNTTSPGWGVVFNGRQTLTNNFFITWHSSYNNGITRQILIFAGTDQGAVLTQNGDIELENAITLAFGGGYQLTKSLSTNIAYAYMDRGNLEFRPDNTLESGGMGHFNFIWTIEKFAMAGIEYAWGNINNLDKAKGNANRLQAMVKYSF
ncbi:DcaP family trimeric outer membrane transporter [Marinigracilibium pacificum]|uniref:Porin n=1 Tax=Marinigracilibium pacificum TaxID=2729599 RepID=A0A848IUZ7_9BACT|nr:DcaP family trimeric outer membrane transporter [Marinigracilibium pacificum]NMM48323.1 hypothetical protein [Marinigracilibium pacificum]